MTKSSPRPAYEHNYEANRLWAFRRAAGRMARWAVSYIDLRVATGFPDAVWEPFQIDYLNAVDKGPTGQTFIANSKTRQCGFSFLLGLEAIVRSACYPGSLTNIVSINRDEAEEKIRYARQVNEAVWVPGEQLRWKRDNREDLIAVNGSRIRSHACRPPRGRPGAHHRLDEVAHYQKPALIYEAAVAGTLRGGSITCCSSPWVRGGFHYSLMEEPANYQDFVRMWVPWWAVFGLCNNVAEAVQVAPALPTAERVERYGSERLKRLFHNISFDAFQVECELTYADDSLAWLTWQEIMDATGPEDFECIVADGYEKVIDACESLLKRKPLGPIFAGYDVARKKDLAVLTLCELVDGKLMCIAILILRNVSFHDQKAILKRITPLIERGIIDATGIGANIAEDMHRSNFKWTGIVFSEPAKAELATGLRNALQTGGLILPPNRELQMDLHSVQRQVTAASHVVFHSDPEDKEVDGHADRFWSLALTVQAATRGRMPDVKPEHIYGQTITAVNQDTHQEQKVTVKPFDAEAHKRELENPGAGDVRQQTVETLYPALKRK